MDKVRYMDKRHVQNVKLYGICTGKPRPTLARWPQISPKQEPRFEIEAKIGHFFGLDPVQIQRAFIKYPSKRYNTDRVRGVHVRCNIASGEGRRIVDRFSCVHLLPGITWIDWMRSRFPFLRLTGCLISLLAFLYPRTFCRPQLCAKLWRRHNHELATSSIVRCVNARRMCSPASRTRQWI